MDQPPDDSSTNIGLPQEPGEPQPQTPPLPPGSPTPTPGVPMPPKPKLAKKSGKAKWIVIGIVTFLAIMWIIGVAIGPKKKTTSTPQANKTVPEQKTSAANSTTANKQTEQKTTTDLLWEAFDKTEGNRAGYSLEYHLVKNNPEYNIPAYGVVTVTRMYGADGVGDKNDFIRSSYLFFVKYGAQALKVPNVKNMEVLFEVPRTDSSGKISSDIVLDLVTIKETFQKCDWEALKGQSLAVQMEAYCTSYFISPTVGSNESLKNLFLVL